MVCTRESFVIYAGRASQVLGASIARQFEAKLGLVECSRFASTETKVRLIDDVEHKIGLVEQSHVRTSDMSANDVIFEQLAMINAAALSGSRCVVAVCPYVGYSRQNRQTIGLSNKAFQEPITACLVANMLKHAGASILISVDPHSDISTLPFGDKAITLSAIELLCKSLQVAQHEKIKPLTHLVVAPDQGASNRAKNFGQILGLNSIALSKTRSGNGKPLISVNSLDRSIIHSKICIIVDDMVDTGETALQAAQLLKELGAKSIILVVTHGVLSGEGVATLAKPIFDKVYLTDTIDQTKTQKILGKKLTIVSIAPLLALTIKKLLNKTTLQTTVDRKTWDNLKQ
jgi:ribose-phosphate pyrophosphokinase